MKLYKLYLFQLQAIIYLNLIIPEIVALNALDNKINFT